MLQTIRDRMSGPILWVVILAISLPFAIWGVQSFQGGGADPTIAKVGGVKITQAQFRNAYESAYEELQQRMGPNFDASTVDQAALRQSVLKRMIDGQVLKEYAQDSGYRIDDGTLRAYLESMPYFQDQGHFSVDRYKTVLQTYLHTTPDRFEEEQRQSLPVEQLRSAVLESAFVTPVQQAQVWKLDHQERVFSYVVFDPAHYEASLQIGDDQVQKRYDEKKSSYQAPERVKLNYVELALEQMPKADPPNDDVLREIYERRKASLFSTPEERKASHILVAFGADKAAAQKKAQELYEELKAGGDMTQLARDNSDDPGSRTKGGDLGWVRKGMMVPKFEEALFALSKPGDISPPVETQFGWHVIRLDELRPAQTKSFDDPSVRKQLVELWQQQDAAKNFQDQSTRLEQLSFENPSSLDAVTKALGLQQKTTDWFNRKGGTGISGNAAVIAAAFSQEVLKDGDNSKPIAVDSGHIVVVRKAEYEAPRQLEFAEVKEQIRAELKTEQAAAKAAADASGLLKTVNDGGSTFEAAVKSLGLEPVSPGAIQRDDSKVDGALRDAVFKMPRPTGGKLGYAQATIGDGKIAVIAMSAVNDPPVQSTDANTASADATRVRDAEAGAELAAYRDAVQKKVKVQIKAMPAADAGG